MQQFFFNESLLQYWKIKCNLRYGAQLGAINNAFLHHKSCGKKSGKILFQIFHLFLAMKNTAKSTCALTARILTVKVSVVQFFFLFFYEQESPIRDISVQKVYRFI